MALLSTQVLPDNTLEEFRIEFNKLVTDVTGLSLGNTFDTQIIFEGTTDDTFETGVSVTDPTADRSIVFPDQSGNVILDSANISLADNIELQFGTGSDLKIVHDGSNSIIRDSGTGSLFLEGDTVSIRDEASSETMADFVSDGAVTLYHNNVAIVATAATGISVAGDVTATDDLILDSDAAVIQLGDDQEVTLTHVHDTGLLLNSTMAIQFNDASQFIKGSSNAILDLGATDKIGLTATLIEVNGNQTISGTLAQADAITMATNKKIIFRDAAIHISSTADGDLSIAADDEIDITSTLIDINGNVDISGTALITGVTTHGDDVVSDTDSTDDLGTTGVRWANLFVDAITATDQITATGFTGTLDGILGSGAAAAATTTTLASTTITASGIVKTDDTTNATSTTDGSLQTDGGLSVVLDAVIGDDLLLLSDAAVLSFGANSEVTLTHVHNDGLLLNTDMQLQFRDSAINIRSDDDGDLDINADDEIELNSTLIDINGNLDVSGTFTGAGLMTTGGNIVIPNAGTIGTASDADAVAISSAGLVSLSATNAIKLNVGTTAQRPTAAAGQIRYNSTLGQFEGYGSAWGSLGGGATGGGSDTVFVENSDDVTTDYSITSGKNAMSVGPITIEAGIDVTIPSGSRWVIL